MKEKYKKFKFKSGVNLMEIFNILKYLLKIIVKFKMLFMKLLKLAKKVFISCKIISLS